VQRHEPGIEASLARGLVPVPWGVLFVLGVECGNGIGLLWVPSWQLVAVACDTCQRSVRSRSSSHLPDLGVKAGEHGVWLSVFKPVGWIARTR
jgi:hypothetical protein